MGFERVGMDDFVKANVWDEKHLFVDENKNSDNGSSGSVLYSLMGAKRGNAMSLFGLLLNKKTYTLSSRAKKENIEGDMTTGDGLQLGGVFIFDKDGKLVFEHLQKNFTDHPTPEDVLKEAKKAMHTATETA